MVFRFWFMVLKFEVALQFRFLRDPENHCSLRITER
jgi:hypothetical protein